MRARGNFPTAGRVYLWLEIINRRMHIQSAVEQDRFNRVSKILWPFGTFEPLGPLMPGEKVASDMKDTIGFDADGVLPDSRCHAHTVASSILALICAEEALVDQGDFERLFGPAALDRLAGHRRADALRGTHRLAMLSSARGIPLIDDTLAVVESVVL